MKPSEIKIGKIYIHLNHSGFEYLGVEINGLKRLRIIKGEPEMLGLTVVFNKINKIWASKFRIKSES